MSSYTYYKTYPPSLMPIASWESGTFPITYLCHMCGSDFHIGAVS